MAEPNIDGRIAEHGRQWRQKPALRDIYLDLYRRMAAQLTPGAVVETVIVRPLTGSCTTATTPMPSAAASLPSFARHQL